VTVLDGKERNSIQLYEGLHRCGPPDAIRYIFYHNVISHSGVPRSAPSMKAWSTAYIDATLIV